MSGNIVSVDEGSLRKDIKNLMKKTVEKTLNAQLSPHAGDGEAEVHSEARAGQEEVPGHIQTGGDGRAEGKGGRLEEDGAEDGLINLRKNLDGTEHGAGLQATSQSEKSKRSEELKPA